MFSSAGMVAFVAVSDLDKADAFYAGTLGMTQQSASEWANVYETEGTELRVIKAPDFSPQPFTVLGWNVPSIDRAVDELDAAGVTRNRYEYMEQDDRDIWTAPSGARIVWFEDPFGNVLSVQQLP